MRTVFPTGLRLFVGCTLVILLAPGIGSGQYILNGNATQNSCNCYTLTQAINWQSGSVWNATKINLNNSFDFVFDVNLGCQDVNGADGIVFMLQPISTSLGGAGGGIGFLGVTPSIGITLDTWQNTEYNDPAYDHISIQANGVIAHGTDLSGPVQLSSTSDNVEDCGWHLLRITWDASTKWLRAYFDGVMRVEAQNDLVANIFSNDPMVYWGFTSATGGANNHHQFCTALNPEFTSNLTANAACIGTPVIFQDASQSFAPIQSWFWEFGDGATSTLQNPPPHTYASPGQYVVKLTITGLDGCVSSPLTRTITIGSKPVAVFQAYDTCFRKPPRLIDNSTSAVGAINQWTWYVDGNSVSSVQQPILAGLNPGAHQVKLIVKTIHGCESDTAYGNFVIKPIPEIVTVLSDGCLDEPMLFDASQTDLNTSITQWNWNFGDGQGSNLQQTTHSFSATGTFNVSLWAIAANGCSSDTLRQGIFINKAVAFAGNDTMVIKNIPFQLRGSGGTSFNWTPSTGLSDPAISNPTATLQDDIIYALEVVTAEGCRDTDTIKILVFKGSAVYVPTGFTPNNDGLNELLKPRYIGIIKLEYFRVYNRWGQLVFSTKDLNAGWDGKLAGQKQPTGTYVWMLKAEDLAGKIYQMKGTSTIIK